MKHIEFIETVLGEASQIALTYFGNVTTTTKPDDNNSVLTEADIAIGEHLVSAVTEQYPEHNIIDEEAGVIDNGSEYTWVIDPIEATSNFAAKSPAYAIMIGLLKGDIPVAGGIVLPAMGSMYLGAKGQGATHNGEPIHVTKETDLSRVAVSFSVVKSNSNPQLTIDQCRILADVILAARSFRNLDCEGVDPMYVAEGIYGGRINCTSYIWDNVAPQIIIEEAGGVWTDTNGAPLDYSNPLTKSKQNYSFCTASSVLHEQLIRVIDGRLEK